MIAALAEGTSHIRNFSNNEDCAATLKCLEQLGVSIGREGSNIEVEGVGGRGLRRPGDRLDCRNSGSTMRMLAGILAGQNFNSTLTGDSSLLSRPMGRIMEPLELMGARVSANGGCAPLLIEGRRPLKSIRYELPVPSAQVKSCVLLAGVFAEGRTEVIENRPTRDHTERMLEWFDAPIEAREEERDGLRVKIAAVEGPGSLQARDVSIPGDISSAAYFIAAAALLAGSDLKIADVGLNPTRAEFLDVFSSLGANVSIEKRFERCNEPVGTIIVRGKPPTKPKERGRSAHMVRGALIPQLIDELPLLAVFGTQVDGGVEIRDAAELRVKESDRIKATVANLRAMGARVEEFDDGLSVAGPTRLRGATVEPAGDHRIAMAFAVAGLFAEGETEIRNPECVAVSFPGFFDLLSSVED
jgi:3-phosphoshikimate 1-carboxyvinyltransferase